MPWIFHEPFQNLLISENIVPNVDHLFCEKECITKNYHDWNWSEDRRILEAGFPGNWKLFGRNILRSKSRSSLFGRLLLLEPRVGVQDLLPTQLSGHQLLDDDWQIVDRHSNLQHRVSFSQGRRVGLGQGVKVDADAEGDGDLKESDKFWTYSSYWCLIKSLYPLMYFKILAWLR